MQSILVVTTAASTLQLLSIAEMRVAAGLQSDDASKDEILNARGLGVAADIMSQCNIAVGKGAEPTLLKETLEQTFLKVDTRTLILARRHNVEIESVTRDGVLVDESSYDVDPESGILTLAGLGHHHHHQRWRAEKIVVVYTAGFEIIPGGLKQEALDRFISITSESERDPYVKGTSIETIGVETVRTDYWAGALPGSNTGSGAAAIPASLKRFYNAVMA
ncbi:hypothetical protein V1291_000044 [Nitrobacteraceae bacterium AZCC 1564]